MGRTKESICGVWHTLCHILPYCLLTSLMNYQYLILYNKLILVIVIINFAPKNLTMKRKFEEISDSNKENTSTLYGHETKKRKLENQRIGDFIVDAKQAMNFRIGKHSMTNY